LEVQIDPAGLADATAQNGVCVPALLAATRKALEAPEHAQFLHWGATSQDIIDTGLALRLRRALEILAERLDTALDGLAQLALREAETPMAARTYGQVATPTSFGAVVAGWGEGLLTLRSELDAVRAQVEIVTLNGAAGTLSVMGAAGPAIRADMAAALQLQLPLRVPHADRSHIAALAAWLTRVCAASGKMATDLLLLTRDGAVRLGSGGASSTMPQKQNPVAPSVIRALALHATGLNATLQNTAMTWDQRDGSAWFAEWLALPQLVVAAGRVLDILGTLEIAPDADILRAPVEATDGLIHAEAVSFALAQDMSRPDAQAKAKDLALEVRAKGGNLIEAAGLDPAAFTPEAQWGEAPDLARSFAAKVQGA
jgi:3-carboxy-cis,cis-muconate cycloisomerase